MRVRSIDPGRDRRWEDYVAAHPDALVYHHAAWLEVLERAYGYELAALACETGAGELRGVLPLFRTRGFVTGRRLSSLPHTPVAGPLASDDAASAELLRAAIRRVQAEKGARLQLKAPSAALAGLVEGLTEASWESTYVMDLPPELERLRFGNSRNHGRIRWAVNKAARMGVRVRPAETKDELRAWYGLYLDTMRHHVVPPRPYRFFEAMWDVLRPRGMMRLLLAEQEAEQGRRLLAGSVFLWAGSTAVYAFTGGSRKDLRLRPNDVIQWTALHDACKEGFRRYDFGEVDADDSGLAEFKRKWGAEPTLLYRYYYPVPSRAERGVLVSGRLRRIGGAAWRRLPLRVTAMIGDRLYRNF